MSRLRQAVSILLSAALFFAATTGTASGDNRAAAEAVLQEAHDLTDIRAEGNPPFRLAARLVYYDKEGKEVEGAFRMFWKSPTSWRSETRFPEFEELRVASGETVYIKRNRSSVFLEVFQLTRLVIPTVRLPVDPDFGVRKLREAGKIGERVIEMGSMGVTTVEIHVGSPLPLPTRILYPRSHRAIEIQDYREFKTRHVATTIAETVSGKPYLRAEVQAISAEVPESALLVPPDGALALGWCPEPKPAKYIDRTNIDLHPSQMPKTSLAIYGIIGADGRWYNVDITRSSGDLKGDASFVDQFLWPQRFHPAMCGDRPVAEEIVLEFKR